MTLQPENSCQLSPLEISHLRLWMDPALFLSYNGNMVVALQTSMWRAMLSNHSTGRSYIHQLDCPCPAEGHFNV